MGQEQVKSILLIWAELNCAKLFFLIRYIHMYIYRTYINLYICIQICIYNPYILYNAILYKYIIFASCIQNNLYLNKLMAFS